MPRLDKLLSAMAQNGASDLHISSEMPPMYRIDGELTNPGLKPLSYAECKDLLYEMITDEQRKQLETHRSLDFAYEIPDVSRFRANFFFITRGISAVFRQIPTRIKTAEELGLPNAIKKLARLKKGLVVVTGPTGSGKSTTLAAMVDLRNQERREHILTLEDPVEFVHKPKNCLINQREIGRDARSFAEGLRAALREDPDVILVGEMRDLETIQLAITAAETGHLVFGTLHTNSAAKTVDRIIDAFPQEQQAQIRTMLSESLKGVVAQTLVKRAEGRGRAAALEILIATPALANIIREGKTYQIPTIIQTGKKEGMRTLDDSLMELMRGKVITAEEAFRNAVNKELFMKYVMIQREETSG